MRHSLSKIHLNRMLSMQLGFTALAFAAMVVLSYVFMSIIVRGNLVRNANSVLDFAEDRIASSLFRYKSELEGFAETVRGMILRGDSADVLREHINDISSFALLSEKEAYGAKGFYVYFENMPGGPVFIHSDRWLPPREYRPEERDWYKMAVAAGGGTVETVPYYASDAKCTLLTYAKCILDDQGRRLGVVCLDVQIDTIGQGVVNTALNQGGYGMLLDQNLVLLAHPNENFARQHLSSPGIPVAVFAEDLQRGNQVSEQPVTSYKGEYAVAFFRKLPNGWHVGLVTPDEQYYKSIASMAAIFGLLGVILAAVLFVILIRIDAAKAKSDAESKQKSMFLANMSHEIRTPINAIVGMTAIGRVAVNADRKDYCFAKINDASRHLLGVINDILDISKIEANKIELSETEFLFEKMLQQVVNVINFRIDEKHQKLTVHIDKAIPRTLVADDQRFAQVITNLLSNAVKFTPDHGSISLKTYFLGEHDGVCAIKVEVADTGIGISQEQQEKLFHSFQQAESSTSRKYGGTGLGLSISKSIVKMMGGEIWVTSELGQGTTFAFTVKVKRGEDTKRGLAYQNINWSNVRILTVDDDPDILTYFQEIMANFGTSCDVAADAAEALRLVGQHGAYNMYFVDLKMPEVDGISLTKEIRAREQLPGASVIIMISSADLNAVENEAKMAGVDKFLLKPLFPSSITDIINECIGIVNDKNAEVPLDIKGIFAGHHILLAEDIDINREIVLALLEPTLVRIDCAENGLEAVKMFSAAPEQYDMIFMDVQMPEMDGYEASRQIRALGLPRAGTIPIVAMTANVFKEDIARCLAAGMSGHIGKPLDMTTLLETIIKYLDKGQLLAAKPD